MANTITQRKIMIKCIHGKPTIRFPDYICTCIEQPNNRYALRNHIATIYFQRFPKVNELKHNFSPQDQFQIGTHFHQISLTARTQMHSTEHSYRTFSQERLGICSDRHLMTFASFLPEPELPTSVFYYLSKGCGLSSIAALRSSRIKNALSF